MSSRLFLLFIALLFMFIAGMAAVSTVSAQTVYTVPGDSSDVQMYEDGATIWVGQKEHRVGRSNHNSDIKDTVSFFVFQLPILAAGDNITSAHLDFNSVGGSWSPPSGNLNLYGLDYRAAVNFTVADFFQGPFGSDPTDATAIQQDFGITWVPGNPSSANGTYRTDTAGDQALVNYLTAQYIAGATGGEFVILRLNLETPQFSANAFWLGSASNDNPPVLTIGVNGATNSDLPVANAGSDQSVKDDDSDGFASVALDGSRSTDANGVIVSYVWTEGESQIATGKTPALSFEVGTHNVTLTVTNDRGTTDSDMVVVNVAAPNSLQLLNLKDTPTADRFPLPTDYVWPINHGDHDICLWNDDKWGAISITIDDNLVPDHDWWIEQLAMYNWKATWFVVTSNLDPGGNSFYCCWPEFHRLADIGHDIQSHSAIHHDNDDARTYTEVNYEYEHSQAEINAHITTQQCTSIAYPYGRGQRDIAAQYYIGNRGTTGGVNQANRIDYMSTKSGGSSGLDPLGNIEAILTGSSTKIHWLGAESKRGWGIAHYHYIQDPEMPLIALLADELSALKQVEDKIWVGTFTEVAKYGQERDTAKLIVTSTTDNAITFMLGDDMMNSIFTYPLTIKFRVNNDWQQCKATQNGNAVKSWIVEHEGNKYALVKAVPDQGKVVLSKSVFKK